MPANSFNDQLCTEDLLSSQKFLSSNYNNAVHESANSDLRRDLTDIQRQEQDAANKIFQMMNQRGWYKVAPADPQMLNNARFKAQQQMGSTGSAQGTPGAGGTSFFGGQVGGGMGTTMGGTAGMGSHSTPSGKGGTYMQTPGSRGSSGMGFQEQGNRQPGGERKNF